MRPDPDRFFPGEASSEAAMTAFPECELVPVLQILGLLMLQLPKKLTLTSKSVRYYPHNPK